MKVVVDASVAVKWYVQEEHSVKAETLLNGSFDLNAPELICPEFGSIIWKKYRRGALTSAESRSTIKAFKNLTIRLYPHLYLLESAYVGAELTGQTVYDWSYLALAVSLNCALVTADEKFYAPTVKAGMKRNLIWVGDL
jgi:predicted nucleic acid-binding protein